MESEASATQLPEIATELNLVSRTRHSQSLTARDRAKLWASDVLPRLVEKWDTLRFPLTEMSNDC